jgi:hypothetical protein
LTTLLTDVIDVVMSERSPVYLRGVPTRLVREAKAAAARRGSTLAAFVSETIERGLMEPGGDDEGAAELRDAMRWYERNRARLLARHAGEYVAIVGRRVLDHDPDFAALAGRVFERLGVRSVFMPYVQAPERRARLRSPRVRR